MTSPHTAFPGLAHSSTNCTACHPNWFMISGAAERHMSPENQPARWVTLSSAHAAGVHAEELQAMHPLQAVDRMKPLTACRAQEWRVQARLSLQPAMLSSETHVHIYSSPARTTPGCLTTRLAAYMLGL